MAVLTYRSTQSDKIKSTYKYKSGEINHEKLNRLRDKAQQYLVALYNKVHNKQVSILDYQNEVVGDSWKFVLSLTAEDENKENKKVSHGRK